MAYNLFDSIFKMVNPETQQAFGQAGQAISKSFSPLAPVAQGVSQAVTQTGQQIAKPFVQAGTNIVAPVKQQFDYTKKVSDYYKPFRESINQLGLTAEDIAQIPEDKKEQIMSGLREIGVTLPEMQQPVQQIPQGEDLGFFGSIKEGGIGAFRSGEQIPRIAGAGMDYLTQNVTGPLVAGGLEYAGATDLANKYRQATKTSGEAFKKLGADITMAGMTDGGTNPLTKKQISARQTGGELALTAPIGGGYLAGAKGVGGLALRSGVVGAGFGATQPIIDKGGQATVGDIATGGLVGGVTGAVAGPLIGKVIAPAIGSIASKTGKYGTALIKGGVEGANKSIIRDVNAVKTGIQKGIQNRADIASTNINRMNAGQIRSFNEEIGVSPGKFLNDRGLNDTGDNLVENLSKNLKLSRKSADEGLANIKGNFKAPKQEVATATVDGTGKFVTKQVDPVETMLRDNLENASSKGMSKESLRAKQLLEKYQKQGLSMTEINEAKRFLNANNKFSYFSDDVSPRKGFVTNLDNEVRKWQFQIAEQQGFTNLKDINKDTKAYYKLLEGIGGWQDKIAGNNPMGLTDWLAFNADPSVFLAKQVAQSNIAKRGYLKGLNTIGGRKIQPEIKKPTNLIKNDILNSNNSSNVPSSKRINVKNPIVKPNIIKNESKVIKPTTGDTIPEGYFKNAFGEIQKNPSNKKGGFIKIPEIGKKVEPLIEEAKKYKSAEEFINSKGKSVYHGTNSDSKDFTNTRLGFNEKDNASKGGVWFSDSVSTAKSYGKNTKQAKIDTKNFDIIDADGETYGSFVRELEDAMKEAKIKGKDGLIIKNFSDRKDWGEYDMATHYVVFNRDTIKTPDQLKQIYEQSKKLSK